MTFRVVAAALSLLLLALFARPGAGQDEPQDPERGGGPAADGADGVAAEAERCEPGPARSAGAYVEQLVVSDDGSRVAAMTANSVHVWDVDAKEPLFEYGVDNATSRTYAGIALSGDGQLLATHHCGSSLGDTASVWQVARRDRSLANFREWRPTADGGQGDWEIESVNFDGPGRDLVIWRKIVGPSVVRPETHDSVEAWTEPPAPSQDDHLAWRDLERWPDRVYSVSFSPDGEHVAIGTSSAVAVHSWPDLKSELTATHGGAFGYHAQYTAGGSVLLASALRRVGTRKTRLEDVVIAFDVEGNRLWDRAGERVLAVPRDGPPCDALLRKKTGGIELVDVVTGNARRGCPGGGRGSVTAAAFSPDGRFLWLGHRDAGDVREYAVPARDDK